MDETYEPENDRAARRRLQNRIAQRNHRKRKAMNAQQRDTNPLSPCRQQGETEKLWQQDITSQSQQMPDLAFDFQQDSSAPSDSTANGPQLTNSDALSQNYLEIFDGLMQEPNESVWQSKPEDIRAPGVGTTHCVPVRASNTRHERKGPANGTIEHFNRASQGRSDTAHDPHHPFMLSSSRNSSNRSSPSTMPGFSGHVTGSGDSSSDTSGESFAIFATGRSERGMNTVTAHGRKGLRPLSSFARTSHHSAPGTTNTRPPSERRLDALARSDRRDDDHGQTCLHIAAKKGSTSLVRYLLKNGSIPDTVDGAGMTPLHHAIRGRHKGAICALLQGNADIEVADNSGRTALHVAVEEEQDDIVVLLINEGADPQAPVLRKR